MHGSYTASTPTLMIADYFVVVFFSFFCMQTERKRENTKNIDRYQYLKKNTPKILTDEINN